MIDKKRLNFENISQIFFVLAILSMFFPIRDVFPTKEAFQTGAYSDFTSISLYLSDIFLIISFLFILPRGILIVWSKKWLILLSFLLIITSLLRVKEQTSLNCYFLAKYLEFIFVAYGTGAVLMKSLDFRRKILSLFLILGTFESILAIWQFIIQKSIGLKRLGEQVIAPNIQGIAKIVVAGKEYIRSYGTFPHPNLLSAFLFTTLLLNIYLLLRAGRKSLMVILMGTLLVNIFGFMLTFSRAAYLAFVLGLLVLIVAWGYKKMLDRKVLGTILLIVGGFLLAIVILRPFLLTRATISDDASLERIFYAKIGIKIIQKHPLMGDGLGQTVLDMQKYSQIKLWPWQIQPIHNYFLLAAAEMGIISAIVLLVIFLLHIKQIISQIRKDRGDDINLHIISLGILLGYLVLMQFDHYFYTIEQTQLLLWIMLGFVVSFAG